MRVAYLRMHLGALPLLRSPDQDAALYDTWARTLLQGRSFVDGPFPMAPGYPIFLSMVYRFFGTDPLRAVLVQGALGVATTALVMLIARRLFGRTEALLAGGILVGYGAQYFYEAKLLGTALAVTLTTAVVWLAVTADRKGGVRWYVAAGLTAGFLGVVRANMLPLPGVLLLVYLLRAVRRRAPVRTTIAFAAGLLVALLPTLVTNAVRGALIPIAANGGVNFYIGNHPEAQGTYWTPPGFSGRITRQAAEADSILSADLGRSLPPGAANRYWMGKGLEEIRANPLHWLWLLGRKATLLVSRHEETNNGSYAFEASRVPLLRFAIMPFNLLLALGLIGLFLGAGRSGFDRAVRGSLAAPLAVLATVTATALLFFVVSRFRLPAVPVLAVFAGHALVRAAGAWRAGSRGQVAAAAATVGVFLFVSWSNPLGSSRNPVWESGLLGRAAHLEAEAGRIPEAIRIYRDALELDPENVDIHLQLAQLAAGRGDLGRALTHLETAARLRPDDAAVQNNLGILFFNARRYDECLVAMARAAALDTTSATPHLYRGLAYRGLDRSETAVWELEEALRLDGTLRSGYVALIEVLLNAGRKKDAAAWAGRAAKLGVVLPAEVLQAVQ